jgi:hypothetical protein
MDSGLATVLAAAVTGAFALLAVLVNRSRKENKNDHAYVSGLLAMLYKSTNRIETKVDRVDERLTNHIESHLYEGVLDNGRSIQQDGVESDSEVS